MKVVENNIKKVNVNFNCSEGATSSKRSLGRSLDFIANMLAKTSK
jgi:hypothetical protein